MRPEDLQAWATLIGSFGFPIAVAWYLLTTLNKTLADLGSAIEALRRWCSYHNQDAE